MLDARALRDRLPRLRRYVYLFTGSHMAADCAVAMTLARLPLDGAGRPHAEDEGRLYGELTAAAAQLVCPPDLRLPPLHGRLLALDPPQRALLLLVTVERLPPDVAGAVCGVEEPADVLATARARLDGRAAVPTARTMPLR